jgi:hypothetical protein
MLLQAVSEPADDCAPVNVYMAPHRRNGRETDTTKHPDNGASIRHQKPTTNPRRRAGKLASTPRTTTNQAKDPASSSHLGIDYLAHC